jgi:hypothetical protein
MILAIVAAVWCLAVLQHIGDVKLRSPVPLVLLALALSQSVGFALHEKFAEKPLVALLKVPDGFPLAFFYPHVWDLEPGVVLAIAVITCLLLVNIKLIWATSRAAGPATSD